ncbi:hypothetical protein ACTMTJ_17630 [Phytohabitans sp. LJ34]|uniref:hypothetical protein n=1 Tax=Phytohabitans sp. LJ34 TaxID=3452217 RepID=UPI003F8AA246
MACQNHGKQVRSGQIRPRSLALVGGAVGVRASVRVRPSLEGQLLRFHEIPYRLGQLVARDLLAVDEQLGKDDLVHRPLEAGPALVVEGLRVTYQRQRCQEHLTPGFQPAGGVGQLCLHLVVLGPDRFELLADLVPRPARRSHQFQVLVLLGVELAQANLEALLQRRQAAQVSQ